jgi:hypothetical protein
MKFFLLLGCLLVIVSCKKDVPLPPVTPPIIQSNQIVIPNGDFEDWELTHLTGFWQPNKWKTDGVNCVCGGTPFDYYLVKKDSQTVQHGIYSAKLICSPPGTSWAKNKFATAYHPSYLQAYVKDTMVSATDSVLIKVDVFYQNNHVDSGMWMATASIPTYSLVNIPITQNSSKADSVMITIQGERVPAPFASPPYSSPLWVDNLLLFK